VSTPPVYDERVTVAPSWQGANVEPGCVQAPQTGLLDLHAEPPLWSTVLALGFAAVPVLYVELLALMVEVVKLNYR